MSNMATQDPMMQMLMQALAQAKPPMQGGGQMQAPQPPNMFQQQNGVGPSQMSQGLQQAGGVAGYFNNPGAATASSNPTTQAMGQIGQMAGKSPGASTGALSTGSIPGLGAGGSAGVAGGIDPSTLLSLLAS